MNAQHDREALQAAEKLVWRVILRSPPFLLAHDGESRIGLKTLSAAFLAEFTLSEMRRSFSRDCGIRMTANGLGMTAWKGFSAACLAIGNCKDGYLGNPGIHLHNPRLEPFAHFSSRPTIRSRAFNRNLLAGRGTATPRCGTARRRPGEKRQSVVRHPV